ncbi:MAG: tyrosine-type recombinase/integrase [Planctomycetaceae bacterium]|nr:tyrosine-type recombinase/integrase [Planctomycetaceae bacterium]
MPKLLEEFFEYHKLEHRTEHRIRTVFKHYLEIKPDASTENTGFMESYQLQNYLTSKYDRSYVNRLFSCYRRVFNWGVLLGYVPAAKAHELTLIPSLRKGDGRCRENKKRTNVPEEHVEAARTHCHRPVIADILELASIHGARPSEFLNLCPADIDFKYDGKNWLALPEKHKTAGKGYARPFVLCKRSQEILQKYMPDDPHRCFFLNSRGNPFTAVVFSKAVKKVIDKHGLAKFVPYQLRHNAATKIAKEYGREYAQELLGHASPEMTDTYIHNPKIDKIQKLADDRNRKLEHPAEKEEIDPSVIQFLMLLSSLQRHNERRDQSWK